MGNVQERNARTSKPAGAAPGADPEFDRFLAHIGYGHLYRILPVEPETPPEPVVTKAHTPPAPDKNPTLSRGTIGLLLMLGVVAMVGSVLWEPLYKTFRETQGEQAATTSNSFVPSPFFTLEHFDSVRPGMDAGQLRNLLGLPLVRHLHSPEDARQDWCYAAPATSPSDPIVVCEVILESGKVAEARKFNARDSASFGISWPGATVSRPGSPLRLEWPDGSREFVGGADMMPWVFLCSIAGVETEDLSGLPARICAVRCGADSRAAAAQRRATVYGASPGAALPMPPVSLYWKGTLYSLPFNMPNASREIVKDDLEWLLGHLPVLRQHN